MGVPPRESAARNRGGPRPAVPSVPEPAAGGGCPGSPRVARTRAAGSARAPQARRHKRQPRRPQQRGLEGRRCRPRGGREGERAAWRKNSRGPRRAAGESTRREPSERHPARARPSAPRQPTPLPPDPRGAGALKPCPRARCGAPGWSTTRTTGRHGVTGCAVDTGDRTRGGQGLLGRRHVGRRGVGDRLRARRPAGPRQGTRQPQSDGGPTGSVGAAGPTGLPPGAGGDYSFRARGAAGGPPSNSARPRAHAATSPDPHLGARGAGEAAQAAGARAPRREPRADSDERPHAPLLRSPRPDAATSTPRNTAAATSRARPVAC